MEDVKGYIEMRNKQKLNNNWLWGYYKNNGGKINNPQEFLDNFYYDQRPIVVNGMKVGFEKTNRDLSSFFIDMDKKFKLTTLWEKPIIEKDAIGRDFMIKKFIKVIE